MPLSNPTAPMPNPHYREPSDSLSTLEMHLDYLAQIPKQDKVTQKIPFAGATFTVTVFRDFPFDPDDPNSPRALAAIVHELDIAHQAPKLDMSYQEFLDQIKTVIKEEIGFHFDPNDISTQVELQQTLEANGVPASVFHKIRKHYTPQKSQLPTPQLEAVL